MVSWHDARYGGWCGGGELGMGHPSGGLRWSIQVCIRVWGIAEVSGHEGGHGGWGGKVQEVRGVGAVWQRS